MALAISSLATGVERPSMAETLEAPESEMSERALEEITAAIKQLPAVRKRLAALVAATQQRVEVCDNRCVACTR